MRDESIGSCVVLPAGGGGVRGGQDEVDRVRAVDFSLRRNGMCKKGFIWKEGICLT